MHFSLALITKERPTAESIKEALAPFEEFHSRELWNSPYVEDVSVLEEMIKDYEKNTEYCVKSPEGVIECRWEDKFYRKATPEEAILIERKERLIQMDIPFDYSFRALNGMYDRYVRFVPEGWEEVSLKSPALRSFLSYCEVKRDLPVLKAGDVPDKEHTHRNGWVAVDANNEVVDVIRRKNPNGIFDGYAIGYSYRGFIRLKDNLVAEEVGAWNGERPRWDKEVQEPFTYDSAPVYAIDFQANGAKMLESELKKYDQFNAKYGHLLHGYLNWHQCISKFESEGDFQYKKAGEFDEQQELTKALKGDREYDIYVAHYLLEREMFVDFIQKFYSTPYAYIKDGEFHTKSDLWGNYMSKEDVWEFKYHDMVKELNPSDWITIIDIHT